MKTVIMKNVINKNSMLVRLLISLFLLSALQIVNAATTVYSIRVDGLACPYCAYGIEKKLNEIDGVKFMNMDLDKGIVIVESYDVKLNDKQLMQLFQDAGFTYRSKTETEK